MIVRKIVTAGASLGQHWLTVTTHEILRPNAAGAWPFPLARADEFYCSGFCLICVGPASIHGQFDGVHRPADFRAIEILEGLRG